MGRLFGTDGVRGVANTEISSVLAMNIGKAAAMVLKNHDTERPTVLIGRDTRLSGDMIEGALMTGLCSIGADVILLGVVPTPAVAYLIRRRGADAGIMISASHNPFEFNGIKLFSSEGYKISDAMEEQIEDIVLDDTYSYPVLTGDAVGSVRRWDDCLSAYIEYVVSSVEGDLTGFHIALDCANGSSSYTAKRVFTRLGANVHVLNDFPDGININTDCGSTHIEGLCRYVVDHHLDGGLAFDGDADRCFAVDENGNVIDGDAIMAAFATDLKSRSMLNHNSVVCTVMTNIGFERYCEEHGISCVLTDVGDRRVLEEMRKGGYNIGGEQCGHVMLLDHTTSDDGQLAGAHLLSLIKRRQIRLSYYSDIIKKYPQTQINIRITAQERKRFTEDKSIPEKANSIRTSLGKRGKLVVRVSGTEPLARVMVQGVDVEEINRYAREMADYIRERLK